MSDFTSYLARLLKNIPIALRKSPTDGYKYAIIATQAIAREWDAAIRNRLNDCAKIEWIEGWFLMPSDPTHKYLAVIFKKSKK